MFKRGLWVVAGLLAVAAFALTPATALAQRRGGGHVGGVRGGGAVYHGGGYRGGAVYRGGYYRGGRGWGWGGIGVGIGLGYPWYGYGGYWPGDYAYSSGPYYYGDNYYDATPYYGGATYNYGNQVYSDAASPDYYYGSTGQAPDNEARVRVVVPEDAKVWFNDRMTQQSGTVRTFESPALTPGRDFSYDVKAQWRDKDGKDVTQTRHVYVRA